jgi:hypothetical protein
MLDTSLLRDVSEILLVKLCASAEHASYPSLMVRAVSENPDHPFVVNSTEEMLRLNQLFIFRMIQG